MKGLIRAWTCALVLLAAAAGAFAADAPSEFASTTIDLGLVVSDLDASVKFYKEVIGFQEAAGFAVGAEYATEAGLTDKQELKVRVLVLGDSPTATKLKVMQLSGAKTTDTKFIHSQLGYRYMTIFVADATAALERLKKAGVKPIGKTPLPLPPGFPENLRLTIVRDPDGNPIELIGPKK